MMFWTYLSVRISDLVLWTLYYMLLRTSFISVSESIMFDLQRRNFYRVKSVRARSYSGPYLSALGLNTKRCGVSLRIQFECGKIRTRITPNTNFSRKVQQAGKLERKGNGMWHDIWRRIQAIMNGRICVRYRI